MLILLFDDKYKTDQNPTQIALKLQISHLITQLFHQNAISHRTRDLISNRYSEAEINTFCPSTTQNRRNNNMTVCPPPTYRYIVLYINIKYWLRIPQQKINLNKTKRK